MEAPQTLLIASENSPSRNSPRGLSAKRFDMMEKVNSVCRCLSRAIKRGGKRETGARPVLSRNCKWTKSHEPGDLPADGTSEATMHGHKTYEGSARIQDSVKRAQIPYIVMSEAVFVRKQLFLRIGLSAILITFSLLYCYN